MLLAALPPVPEGPAALSLSSMFSSASHATRAPKLKLKTREVMRIEFTISIKRGLHVTPVSHIVLKELLAKRIIELYYLANHRPNHRKVGSGAHTRYTKA